MAGVFRALILGVGIGVTVDLVGAFVWLCLYDGGCEYPY